MANYRLDLVTAPTIEPISVKELKTALRIEHNSEDMLLGFLISTARSSAEAFTRRSFITQTWKMFMDSFSGYSHNYPWWKTPDYIAYPEVAAPNEFELPLAPLQSVTHVKTYDDSDTETTFAASNYYVSTPSGSFAQPGTITLRDSATWPTVERVKDGIEIQFVSGYGSSANDIPAQIRMAVQEEASFLYENRGTCEGKMLSSGVAKRLLSQFRVVKL